ncbi:MAG: aryl-sulfate sulfotransferase [Myxococcota bacterium]|nr:aryl-sulfate sulfotransferase [Myxococcota bacterium]
MLLIFIACQGSKIEDSANTATQVGSLTAEASISEEIPTVVNLDLTLSESGQIRVEAFFDDESVQTKPVLLPSPGTVRVPILGIPQQKDVEIEISAQTDTNSYQSTLNIRTGSFPISAPSMDVYPYRDDISGYFLGTIFGPPERLVIFDMQGRILWQIQQFDDNHGGIDSRLSQDKKSIYFNRFSKDKNVDGGHIHELALDGTPIRQIETPMAHHTFTELPDGTLTYIALDPRDTEMFGPVCGDKIVEISPDGSQSTIFSTWGNLTLFESEYFDSTFYPQGHDWTHTNFISYNAESESYWLSMASADIVLEIDRNGSILQTIGGHGSVDNEFQFQPGLSRFSYPHAPQMGENDTLLLMSTVGDYSRALEYVIREDEKILQKVWEHGSDYQYNVRHLGEITDTQNGYRMVNWGSIGHLQLLDDSQHVVWEAKTPLGFWFAQFDYLPSLPGMEP